MINNIRTYLLTALLLTTFLPAVAQSWLDYDQAVARYPLLQSRNAAALTTYCPADSTQLLLGEARLMMNTGHGHLAAPHVAPKGWEANAHVRSIYRMSRRVVVRGSMDYRYGWGKHAGGSVWIDPEQMPFDITEIDDTTRGNISLETYRLNGELGVDVGHGVSLGATFDYTTASGAKKKDPRHVNSLMNLQAGAGITWHIQGFTIGGNYLFGRRTEGLKFSTFGRTDRIYHYLIDNGAYFGREETTDGNGYVNDDNERPLLDISHGLALLAAYRHGMMTWGLEGSWSHRHGHYGLEAPSMIDFNRHNGYTWNIQSWWQRDNGSDMQRVTVSYSHQSIKDHERTYRIITDQGVTDTRYYDDRLMGERDNSLLTVGGDLRWGIERDLAAWQVEGTLTHHRRTLTASLYPFYRQQVTHLTEFTLQGAHNWLTARDQVWSLQLQAGWATGGGTARQDGTYQTPSADAEMPQEHTLYLMRQYEYLTAKRLLAGVQVRWSVPIARQRMRLYAEAGYSYRQAFDIHYLENGHRHEASVAMGCLF